MSDEIARWSRVLQFRAGPGSYTFHACDDCKVLLERAEMGTGLFFATADEPVRPVDPADEIDCDGCAEPADPDGEAYRGEEAAAYERALLEEARKLK
jgi:hypothetical protein